MPRPDTNEPLSVTNNTISVLQIQNISLANKITFLRREKAELSSSKNEYDRKNLALDTNFSFFKQSWTKHLNELRSVRQLQKPFQDKKLEQEFEECFGLTSTVLDSLTFQQPEEEFQEKTTQMFQSLFKIHKDIITGSQRTLESAVERLTQEVEQSKVSTEEGLSNISALKQKLTEFTDSVENIKELNAKLKQNPFQTEVDNLRKKVKKMEEELADVKEHNEVLNRRFKVTLKGFFQINEDLEKEQELGCICGGKIFDYLDVKNVKVTKEVEEDKEDKTNEEKKQNDEAINKDITLLNQKVGRLEKDMQELTHEKLTLIAQDEKLQQEKEKSNDHTQKLQRLEKMLNDIGITNEKESESLKLENERSKEILICPVCELREKSVMLPKCSHTFCRPCITARIEARNRKCPVCMYTISLEDIKTMHLDI